MTTSTTQQQVSVDVEVLKSYLTELRLSLQVQERVHKEAWSQPNDLHMQMRPGNMQA